MTIKRAILTLIIILSPLTFVFAQVKVNVGVSHASHTMYLHRYKDLINSIGLNVGMSVPIGDKGEVATSMAGYRSYTESSSWYRLTAFSGSFSYRYTVMEKKSFALKSNTGIVGLAETYTTSSPLMTTSQFLAESEFISVPRESNVGSIGVDLGIVAEYKPRDNIFVNLSVGSMIPSYFWIPNNSVGPFEDGFDHDLTRFLRTEVSIGWSLNDN